jgi:nitrogen regulatory protein PII
MKAIMIVYNQALTEKVEYMLDALGIRGYTQWTDMHGRGTIDGNPHMGTHTWPEINSSILSVVEDDKVDEILQKVKNIDHINTEVGIRAFVWDIVKTV